MNNTTFSMLIMVASILAGCGTADVTKATGKTPPAQSVAPAVREPAPKAEAPAPTIDLATLALKIDPVCQMSMEEYPAATTAEHGGKTYGFCSDFCKKKFVEAPDAILARVAKTPEAEKGKP